MSALDWVVLVCSLTFIVAYGLWRGRESGTVSAYLLAGRTMPWYAMALSIMATQASAITFISTTSQAYVDGMRFVQFYFGLPLAMVILCATAVPIFHRAGVYTAYEYLERRFDAKTRALVASIFLIQRGLGMGIALSAPAIVLTVILGWPSWLSTLIMGSLVLLYTTIGGIKAVTWTDVQQMLVMMTGLLVALITAIWLLPGDVGLTGALKIAGAAGKINPVVTAFDWRDRYNVWNGLLGGMFLALAYFGCDQSQVQRYLTGKSVAQSRLSLLFNAVAKVPMQFLILGVGAIVFAYHTFDKPPLVFHPLEMRRIETLGPAYENVASRWDAAFEKRRAAALAVVRGESPESYRDASAEVAAARSDALKLAESAGAEKGFSDANYIFLNFVTTHLPTGVVGLIMAAIFAAGMSTTSAEVNSLATVSVIDIYRRFIRREASDRHYLLVSRGSTLFWGSFAMVTAEYARNRGTLIEAVNSLGSLFYGGMLGVFVLAFFFKRVGGTAAFAGVLCGEAAIFYAFWFTSLPFLWFNVIGCLTVVAVGLALSLLRVSRVPAQ